MALLKSILDAIQSLGQYDQETREHIDIFLAGHRSCLTFLVNHVLTDLTKKLTSKKAEGEFEIALSLLEHCEAPPIPGIFSFQHEKSRNFTFWLQSRLLRIYSSERHKLHHQKTVSVHTTILEVIKEREKQAFVNLIESLISLLADLCSGSETGKRFTCAVSDVHVISPCQDSKDPLQEQSMTKIDLNIEFLCQLELLQINTMKVLSSHANSLLDMLDAKQIESLLNSLCWHLEYSSFSVKMSTSLFLAELFATSSWIDKVSHIPVYNLMACIEVLIIHSLNSEDEDLRTAVTSLLRALSQSPAAHSMQLSMMLLESLAESSLRTLTECSLVSSLFDLLLSSMSSQSLVSLAMNKQLTEWIIIKIQTNEACESMICCLGDLIKCLPSAMAAATFAKVSVITESIARSATTAAQVTSSKISDLRFCCQIVTHCYLHWMTSFPAESKEEIVRGIKGLLNTLVVSWSQVLSLADRDLLSSLYSDVVHSISSLLALKDIIQERKLVIQLVIMASLPWLTENYTPDPEANFCVTEEVKSLALTLKPLLSDEILRVCLLSVIVASKEILPKWRLHILRTVSNFKRPVPLTAITKHLQYLLLDQGPPSFHLIYDLLHPVLSLQSCIVDESLAQVLGQLSCIVAGGAELSWKNVKCKTPVWDIDRVICKKCDVTEKQTLQSVDPGMFEPFIQLIYKDSHKIRLLMAAALPRLFSHIKISHANGETMNMLQTTLQLVEDTNRDVRVQFSTLPHRAFQHSSMEVIGQFVDKVLTINASTQDEEMKETLIMTVQSLGRVEDQNLLPICIRFLVESYLSSSQFVTATAFHYLQRLAEFRGLNPSQIYQKNQSMLAECLSEKVVEILSNRYSEELTVMDLFDRASKLFHYESPSLFITSLEKHIVPYLVSSEHTDIHQVLKLIANHVGKSYQQLITTNMKYIFSHLVRSCHRTTLEKKISYLEAETRLSIKSLLRQSFQGVLNQLLLYFGTRHQQIKLGLAFFLSQDGQTQLSSDNHVSDELLAEFIEKHLLGVLVEFDHILLQRSTDIKKKEDVISSLIHVIKLLGSRRVTSLRIKISTSLKLALTTTAGRLPKLCCEAWLCFVKHVEVASLKYMLSYIVVTLLPLIRTLPADVAPVLEYLVVKCRKELSSSFNELYFIPEVPQLSEVNAVLKNYMVFSGRPDAFPLQLKQYLAGVNHDNSEVSKQALIKLRQLLLDNRNQLYQMIGGAETVNPLVTEAMQKLTSSCVKGDDEMKLLYADCLAELGAIDPGKMVTTHSASQRVVRVKHKNLDDINSPVFLLSYLDVLVTALLSANTTRKQDCIALGIQGAISLFDIRNDLNNELWQGLSAQTQDIISPYMDSKYTINDPNWLKVDTPVYMSSKGQVYNDWLCNWTALLASKVTDGFALQLFRSSMAAVSASVDLAGFMLPYIITYILAEGQHTSLVVDEIMVIVGDALKPEVSEFCHVTLQTVFTALDDLKCWLNKPQAKVSKVAIVKADNESSAKRKVQEFLDSFPHDQIAKASLNCMNYARSLLHYEHHMEGDDIQKHLDTLQEIYAAMDEPDGVAGVDHIRERPATLHQQAVVWENVDKLRDAMVCYEEAINIDPTDLTAHEGLMKCYLNLGNWYLAISHSPSPSGTSTDNSLLSSQLLSYKVEAAWKLGNWDLLRDLLTQQDSVSSKSWEVGVGKLILAAKDRHVADFSDTMKRLKKEVMGPLSAASMEGGSPLRGYSYLVQLHMLGDIEAAAKLCFFKPDKRNIDLKTLLNQWETRFDMVQASVRTTEPLVTLRQSLLLLTQQTLPHADLKSQLQKCWLERACIARKANQLVNAYGSLEKAARYGSAEREVEKAKLFWHRGDWSHAQKCLGRIINSYYDKIDLKDVQQKSRAEQLAHAEVYLLYAWYNEGNSKFERAEVMRHYKKAIEVCPTWETSHFKLAVYYDKYLASRPENLPLYWRVYKQTVCNYGMAVRYGSKNVYQSMSRATSLWLDLGGEIASKMAKDRMNNEAKEILKNQQATLTALHSDCIQPMKEHVAGFQWLTVFSQLVSRLCHAHHDVAALLQEIISCLIVQYPQQTVWNMMAISKSSFPIRLQRCQAIFEKAKSKSPALHIFFRDITKLTDRLLELTNKTIEPKTYHISLSEHCRYLKRLLDDPNFSDVMIPNQSAMTVTLPSEHDSAGIPKNHNAFPSTPVNLAGFQDNVEILSSMIRPKKLTVIGSDGKLYPFLCKPKDDLRKDGRLMEFNDIINKLLRKDTQSRRMQLYIKTYAVIPLNEECGLLEWVNNTSPYRTILNQLYKEKGCYFSMSECMKMYKAFHHKSLVDVRLPVFRQARSKYPPILHLWFLKTFPDPTSWYNARITYSRTLAVMSVIGYIVGLGDRHGENILLDSTTGGVMHVDFNCLFNKGLTFDWPEVVPFRLTHNMVAAMGPMGYEGIFRKSAEVTLRVMKQEKDQLMSILRPFIYDPLVEWSKPQTSGKRKGKHSDTGEVTNEQAKTHVQDIQNRLTEGDADKANSLSLSTEGHVQDLISEATDERNLAKMYVGWAAYF